MNRWYWVAFIVILLGCSGAGAFGYKRYAAWKEKGREEAIANISAFSVCLTGGTERISAEEAQEYANRLHETPGDPTLASCIAIRDKIVSSSYMRRELGDLNSVIEKIDLGPFPVGPTWQLSAYFLMSADLPWVPPTHIDGKPIPKPMEIVINSQLELLKYQPHTFHSRGFDSRFDKYQPNSVVVAGEGRFEVVIRDAGGRALSEVARLEMPKRLPPQPDPPKEAKESPAIYLEDTFFWVEANRFFMRRPEEKKAKVFNLPGTKTSRMQSCRAPNRRIFGLEISQTGQIVLFSYRNQSLEPAGIAALSRPEFPDPKYTGYKSDWHMTCDDETVRIAWALAEQGGPKIRDSRGNPAPPPGGFQNVRIETCTQGKCTRSETRIELNIGAFGPAGIDYYDLSMLAVDAYSIGSSVLLLWEYENAYRYRLGPLEELKNPRTEYLAKLHESKYIDWELRKIPKPQVRVLTRGNVALASLIIEDTGRSYLMVVRFDAQGNVEALPVAGRQ